MAERERRKREPPFLQVTGGGKHASHLSNKRARLNLSLEQTKT